jgi:hypothetical protein
MSAMEIKLARLGERFISIFLKRKKGTQDKLLVKYKKEENEGKSKERERTTE